MAFGFIAPLILLGDGVKRQPDMPGQCSAKLRFPRSGLAVQQYVDAPAAGLDSAGKKTFQQISFASQMTKVTPGKTRRLALANQRFLQFCRPQFQPGFAENAFEFVS